MASESLSIQLSPAGHFRVTLTLVASKMHKKQIQTAYPDQQLQIFGNHQGNFHVFPGIIQVAKGLPVMGSPLNLYRQLRHCIMTEQD